MPPVCPLSTLQLDASAIPLAWDNMSRGKWPLWQYINAGVNTMHVNVPNMADVIGALLRAPFAALRAYLLCKDSPEELARFYEDGISDSCFNGKWRALEEFNVGLDKQATLLKLPPVATLSKLSQPYPNHTNPLHSSPTNCPKACNLPQPPSGNGAWAASSCSP